MVAANTISPKATITELKNFPYPNLMAEYLESRYHISTLVEHMGLSRSQEDCNAVKRKLTGTEEISGSEALGLGLLFSVDLDYLLSHQLKEMCGESAAYWRWLKRNQREMRELKEIKEREQIEKELSEKPYLLEFMKFSMTLNVEELRRLTEFIKCYKLEIFK